MKSKYLPLIAIGMLATIATAGYGELDNEKGTCVFLKNNKVIKKQTCYASGSASMNARMGGWGLDFKPIKGYGKISIDYSYVSQVDKFDNVLTDKNNVALTASEEAHINDKPATMRHRHPKTLKVMKYSPFIAPYQCFIAKHKPTYEFCTSIGF